MMTLPQIGAAVSIGLLLSGGVAAQQPTPEQEVMALKGQIAAMQQEMTTLKNDLKAATKKPPLSQEEAVKLVQQKLLATLMSLRDQVQPGCHAIKGKLAITLDASGQVTAVTCAVQ